MATPSTLQAEEILDGLLMRFSARQKAGYHSSNIPSTKPPAHEVGTVPRVLESSSASGGVRATWLLRQWNAMIPIHQIPVELLIQVIQMAAFDFFTIRHFERLFALAQVCKWWSGIVMGSPVLWTKVDDSLCIKSLKRTLQLSEDHPLDVVVGGFIKPDNNLIQRAERTALVCKYIPRWKSASLWCFAEALPHLESSHAPTLRGLSLTGLGSLRALDLFQGHAPQFSRLSLNGLSLKDWSAAFLCGLRSFRLQHIKEGGPSLQQFFRTLRSCPELKILVIDEVQFSKAASELSEFDVSPIHLPALQLLSIQRSAITTILRTIRTTNCPNYIFGYYEGDINLREALTECIRRIPASLGRAVALTVGDDDSLEMEWASQASGKRLCGLTVYCKGAVYAAANPTISLVSFAASPNSWRSKHRASTVGLAYDPSYERFPGQNSSRG
ncbi:hypothetical protein FRB94_003565 [Tulasnella sp. JGI-2019a]|nr:hypothetical protein FRB94_003565 [Tulasnella sp. JGI-2019a]